MLQLSDIWQALIGQIAPAPGELAGQAIGNVVIDSRAARAGDLFVALRGEKTDGHLYLADAFARGARAAFAEPKALAMDLPAAAILPDGTMRRPAGLERGGPYLFIMDDALAGLQKLAAWWRSRMPAIAIGVTGSVGKTTTKEIIANVLAQRFVTLRSEGNLNNEIGLPLTLLKLRPEHERVVLEMGMY
ncbi:MAG: Mur ligase family protein, partial [Anaerolineae bacterium]|nr:Mur ligase family protein [Anaerolineae bacterium]